MNRNDIRKQTCIVIRKSGKYLIGTILYSDELRWSDSVYDAWRTRSLEEARRIARVTGGIMILFNPIIGKTKVM